MCSSDLTFKVGIFPLWVAHDELVAEVEGVRVLTESAQELRHKVRIVCDVA